MKRDRTLWQFGGFALTSLGGTLLHFLYDWTGQNAVVALFSGVNESTWEHMKLLFVPSFVFAIVQSRFFKDIPSFPTVKLVGILTGQLLIPVLFYTLNGAFGKTPDWLNIAVFFVSAAAAFAAEARLLKCNRLHARGANIAWLLLCVLALLFVVFTFFPPSLPLFFDPVTKTYGRRV